MANPIEYEFEAVDAAGEPFSGVRRATSEEALDEHLSEEGSILLEAQPVRSEAEEVLARWRHRGASARDLLSFTHQLGALLGAHVPLLEALRDCRRGTESSRLASVCRQIEQDVERGVPLAESLEKHPAIFDGLYVRMVEAGEVSGQLPDVLEKIVDHMEWSMEKRGQLKKALTYPAILGAAVLALVLIMLTFLLPRIAQTFVEAGVDLPLPTRILLGVSGLFSRHVYVVGAVVATVVAAVFLVPATEVGRRLKDRLALRLPFFGRIVRQIAAARFTYTLSSLLQAGIALDDAMGHVHGVVRNAVLEDGIEETNRRIQVGERLSGGLAAAGVFQPLVVSMVRAGERTGKLDEALLRVNRFYDREIPQAVDRALSFVEPALVVVAGIVVGGMVASVFLPLFKMVQVLR